MNEDDLKKLPTRHLDEKNKNEYDGLIKFEEEAHHYWMMSKYLGEYVSTLDGCGSAPLISTTTILKEYWPESDFKKLALKTWNNPQNRVKMVNDPTYKYYKCACVQDILDVWGQGAVLGTRLHAQFEDFANLVEYDRDHAGESTKTFEHLYHDASLEGYMEKTYFLEFCKQFRIMDGEYRFYRTEFMMAHDVLHLSGMIDGLLYHPASDTYVIIDYKRMKGKMPKDPKNPRKQVHELSPSGRGRGLPAFEALRAHAGNKYGCQLTLYKHLFEHMFPGKMISGMYLIVVDSTKIGKPDALEITEVPLTKYDSCIEQLFEERARDILGNFGDVLPSELMEELIKFLPPVSEEENETCEFDSGGLN